MTRVLLSMDPTIAVLGTIDDTSAKTHQLIVSAFKLRDEVEVPNVTLVGDIGSTAALAGLVVKTGTQDTSNTAKVTDIAIPSGGISIGGSVTTDREQSYTSRAITLIGNDQKFATVGAPLAFDTGLNGNGISSTSGSRPSFDVGGSEISGVGTRVAYTNIVRTVMRTPAPIADAGIVDVVFARPTASTLPLTVTGSFGERAAGPLLTANTNTITQLRINALAKEAASISGALANMTGSLTSLSSSISSGVEVSMSSPSSQPSGMSTNNPASSTRAVSNTSINENSSTESDSEEEK